MFKRSLSLLLAGLMVLSTLPVPPVATAAPAQDVRLNFTTGDPLAATIVQGKDAYIRITKPNGLQEASPPFTVRTRGSADASLSQHITFKDNIDSSLKAVHAGMEMNLGSTGQATFAIQGNFYALLAKGDAYEKVSGTAEQVTKVEATAENAIMEYSEITIKATQGEAWGVWPQFEVVDPNDPAKVTGSFAGYDKVSVIPTGSTQWSSLYGGTNRGKELTIRLESSLEGSNAGHPPKEFKIYPTNINILYGVDQNGDEDRSKIVEQNNYVNQNTEFRLVFRIPTSNELLLTVLTAQQACINIAGEIKRNDGVNIKSYIELGKDDQLDFITKHFSLRSFVDQYNSRFDIEWKWVPNDPADSLALSISDRQAVMKSATINPGQEDIRGKLVATVIHNKALDSGVGNNVTAVAEIPILIRGLGVPGALLETNEWVGGKPETVFPPNSEAPSSKNMNVYDGSVPGFPMPVGEENSPWKYRLQLKMGLRNAAAQYATVEVVGGDKDVVSAQTILNNVPSEFGFGPNERIDNPTKNNRDAEGHVFLELTAQKEGMIKLQVTYYVLGLGDTVVKAAVQPKPLTIFVKDSSPSDDASLKSLVMREPGNYAGIDFGFSPGKLQYDIDVPYSVKEITVTPTKNSNAASSDIAYKYTYLDSDGVTKVSKTDTGRNGYTTEPYKLVDNAQGTLEITVTAQNPNVKSVYVLNITRLPPSDDSRLKDLKILNVEEKNLLSTFNMDVSKYRITVPYSTKMLRVLWETNHSGAKITSVSPRLRVGTEAGWLNAEAEFGGSYGEDAKIPLTIDIAAENELNTSTYTVDIVREAPSTIATLEDLKVTDASDKNLTYTPKFARLENTYEMNLPYATDKIKLSVKKTHPGATVALYDGLTKLADMADGRFTAAIPVNYTTTMNPTHDLTVVVTAEDGITRAEYALKITRAEPENEANLADLKVLDQNKADQKLGFNPEVYSYTLSVPYAVDRVILVPTAVSGFATVTVEDRKVEKGKESVPIRLSDTITRVVVEVTAQDGRTRHSYSITVIRQAPSSDARLKGLTVSGAEALKPQFIANKYSYATKVNVGQQGVQITATTNDPYATLTIRGERAQSGTPTPLIETIDLEERIEIVVTAQDGSTTLTYVVNLTNQNLIERTSNADLRDLVVNYGSMSPKSFHPSVTTYDVAVAEDTASVEILPVASDRLAEISVFKGTKEIGDYRGNYAEYIEDGENDFTVRVTSPDQKATKEYQILIHRGEEDKAGRMTPTTADDIDFTPNPILVDISKYTRVAADVFNELRENHPDKSIVFQGNDYSLEFAAKDLVRTIPSTEVFDFALTFTSPYEEEIRDLIDEYNYNDDIRPVFVHFYHHGALPARAKFTLSLGRRYWSDKLHWHYYNEERERIDYYGTMETNNRGTFTIPLDHMSTYVVTRYHAIRGSNNKTSENPSLDRPLSEEYTEKKPNPNTGEAGEERSR